MKNQKPIYKLKVNYGNGAPIQIIDCYTMLKYYQLCELYEVEILEVCCYGKY